MKLIPRDRIAGRAKRTRGCLIIAIAATVLAIQSHSLRADTPQFATDNTYLIAMGGSVSGNPVTDEGKQVPVVPVTPRVIGAPSGGTLGSGGLKNGGVSGNFTYKPDAHFHGFDSFTYRVNDAASGIVSQIEPTLGTLLASEGTSRLQSWMGPVKLTRVYNAAIDGFGAINFHLAVDGRGPTLTVMRVRDQYALPGGVTEVIGGFNPGSWSSVDCKVSNCNQSSLTDKERTAFLFNLTTGVKLDQRLTTNRCSTDPAGGRDCGSFQTQNNPGFGPAFGGSSRFDLQVGCDIAEGFCSGDLHHGQAFAMGYGGRQRTAAFGLSGGLQHPSIFASSWFENDPINWPDFVPCRSSCGAFVVEALEVFTVEPVAGTHDSSVATVTIQVTGNTPPSAVADSASVRQGKSVVISVLSNDSDAESDPVTMTVTTPPARGTVFIKGDGTVEYTSTGFPGQDSFTYRIDDGFGGVATATVNVTVTARPTLTVKADNQSKTYDGTPYPYFSATFTFSSSETCITIGTNEFGGTAVGAINRGSYTITVTGVTSPDCTVVREAGTLEIARAALDVVPHDGYKVYGQAAALVGHLSGIAAGDHVVISATYASPGAAATANVGTGSFPITVASMSDGGTGKLANYVYDLSVHTATLTVDRKLLQVEPTWAQVKVFGDVAALTGTISGRENGDAITATYTSAGAPAAAPVRDDPGDDGFVVTVAAVSDGGSGKLTNYNQSLSYGWLRIVHRAITVTAAPRSKPFGTSDPPLTFSVTSGSLAAGGVLSGTLTRAAGETVGSYAIQQGSLTAGPNYSLTFVPANLTITGLRPPVAIADSYSTPQRTLTIVEPGVLKNDTDPDGDAKIAVLVKSVTAAQGTLTLLPSGSFTFAPAKGFAGEATFTYRAVDATGLTSNTVTVKIAVEKADQDDNWWKQDRDGHWWRTDRDGNWWNNDKNGGWWNNDRDGNWNDDRDDDHHDDDDGRRR